MRSRRGHVLIAVALLAGMMTAGNGITGNLRAQAAVAQGFELVGQDPLFGRGMNAAPALYNDEATGHTYVYVGSRTDSSSGHPHPGVLIVDTTDPAHPADVGEILGANEGIVGHTSRELRVWPQAKLLIVLHFTCSSIIHACDPVADNVDSPLDDITFYDLTDPVHPTIRYTYQTPLTPHEIFLWVDPFHAGRALLYYTTPASATTATNLVVADISGIASATPTPPVELVHWNANADFTFDDRRTDDVRLHSIGVSPDGTRTYLAYLGGGFMVLDSSPLTNPAAVPPVGLKLLTPVANRAHWGSPGTHSAVKIFGTHDVDGRPHTYALSTDEVYGDAVTPLQQGKGIHGCPWGWMRTLDVTDEAHPAVVGEFKLPENDPSFCTTLGTDKLDRASTSFSSHNPTIVKNVAFITWHSGGLQAIDLADPVHPAPAGVFSPAPLASVATEDPALSVGPDPANKVVLWSYPILNHQGSDTFIYVIDVRNGLFILRYTGAHADEVNTVSFLEGNSNLGSAGVLDNIQPASGPPPTGITFGPLAGTTMHFDSPTNVGEVDRVMEFADVNFGPHLSLAAPTSALPKVQETSRFGNTALAANPLLAYFTYQGAVKIDGAPQLQMWVSAPSIPGVMQVNVGVELFVDGSPALSPVAGSTTFPLDIGPVPTLVTLTLPTINVTALQNIVVQLGVNTPTTDATPKAFVVLYGSPTNDSFLTGLMAFPA
jgi:hypothetical protein